MKYHDLPGNPLGAFEPYARGCMRLHGGGGGGSSPKNYAGLERLYQEQADSARLLRRQAEDNLPGAVDQYVSSVNAITDPGYAQGQADMAASDLTSANAMERAATTREMASMGVNPNDARFAGSLRKTETDNAARLAAGQNLARNDAKKYQLAVSQDAVGTFTGQSNSAASQMGGASSGLANLVSQKNAAKQNEAAQQSANTSNIVGGAMTAWSMFKDGGKVRPLEHHMLGGTAGAQQKTQHGFFQMQEVTPPTQMPTRQQPQGPNLGQLAQAGKAAKSKGSLSERMAAKGAENTDKIGRLVGKINPEAGNQIQSNAAGQRMGAEQSKAAAEAYREAAAETTDAAAAKAYEASAANIEAGAGVDAAASAAGNPAVSGATAAAEGGLSATAPGVAGEVGGMASGLGSAGATTGATAGTASGLGAAAPGVSSAVTGAATGAGTAAATTAASTGLGTAMAAVGTAMPWIGAAYAVGSLLGAWKDGGKIPGAQDYRDGDKVEGPGSHTDDVVPAVLSAKETVLNGEATALVGDEALAELNTKGLELRKQGVPLSKIKKQVGLEVL